MKVINTSKRLNLLKLISKDSVIFKGISLYLIKVKPTSVGPEMMNRD